MSNLPGNYLPGNPHMNDLIIRRNSGNDYTPTVSATLALAYEQRTANLIALWASPGNLPDGSYDKGMEMSGVHYGELATQIKARLGLGETNA